MERPGGRELQSFRVVQEVVRRKQTVWREQQFLRVETAQMRRYCLRGRRWFRWRVTLLVAAVADAVAVG